MKTDLFGTLNHQRLGFENLSRSASGRVAPKADQPRPRKRNEWLDVARCCMTTPVRRENVKLDIVLGRTNAVLKCYDGRRIASLPQFCFHEPKRRSLLLASGISRTEGKSEVKRAALSELRLDPYSSRMFFDHHFCNVESKSYTATILVLYL